MGKKGGGLYENWLKHFTINVMTQSFHAFFLLFVMRMLSEIDALQAASAVSLTSNDGLLALMSIVGMMAIIKFEKLFKTLFGMGDSITGDLKNSGAKLLMGMKAAGQLRSEIGAPFKNASESKKRMQAYGKELGLTKEGNSRGKLGSYIKPSAATATSGGGGVRSAGPQLSDKTRDLYEKMKEAKRDGNMDLYKDYRDHAATQMRFERANTGGPSSGPRVVQTGGAAPAATGGAHVADDQKIKQYNDAVLENRKNARKKWMHTAGTMAALSMGLGAMDETSEVLQVANILNNPINDLSSKVIDRGETVTANKSTGDSRYDGRTISQAIKEGFKDATRNSRTQSGNINPVKLSVDVAKKYVTTSYNVTRNTVKASKVDNIDNI